MLLFSSITYGFAMLSMTDGQARRDARLARGHGAVRARPSWVSRLYEFAHLIHEGAGPQRSAFLSSFFTLVGTHGLHVTFGLIWLVTLTVQVQVKGLNLRQPASADVPVSLFWHFLDVIWIGVFTFVYLMGMLR